MYGITPNIRNPSQGTQNLWQLSLINIQWNPSKPEPQ